MAPFYTRRGDEGYTDLLGSRVLKSDLRLETIGTIDEASAQIGVARSLSDSERTNEILISTQRDLYTLMAELAFTADISQSKWVISSDHVDRIERETDGLAAEIDVPPHFIVPGDTVPGAALDVARTVVRRAERLAVQLIREEAIENEQIIRYMNRLSSLLFILARYEDGIAGITSTRAKR